MPQIPKIPRRIVTGLKNGKSIIAEDAVVTNVSEHFPGLLISDIWVTNQMPVDLSKEIQIENTVMPEPPVHGSYFRYVSIPPDKDLGIKPLEKGQVHPLMHKTDTLDYIIILSGDIHMILDEEETPLKAEDIVVQRGTNHAWSNRSDTHCIQLAVLLDAK